MSNETEEETGKEEAKVESPQGFQEMCRRMMSECCGPQMQETMSRWMAGFQAKKEEQAHGLVERGE